MSGEDKIPVQSSHVDSLVDTKDWQGQERQYIIDQIRKWAAPDGHVVWTLANFGWLEFVLNWVAAVNLAGIDHFFVASLDSRYAAKSICQQRKFALTGVSVSIISPGICV